MTTRATSIPAGRRLPLLVVNLGNTSLAAGVFGSDGELRRAWRGPGAEGLKAPAFQRIAKGRYSGVAYASVVPGHSSELCTMLAEGTGLLPLVLSATSDHGLRIGYTHPREMGADRVAAVLGARALWPRREVIVVDCGTATTVTALTADGVVPGGAIMPGAGLWSEVLYARTAQLPPVPVPRRAPAALGRGTRAGIGAGLWYGHAGAMRELVAQVRREAFGAGHRVFVVGTGGGAQSWESAGVFDAVEPALVLRGLRAFLLRHAGDE